MANPKSPKVTPSPSGADALSASNDLNNPGNPAGAMGFEATLERLQRTVRQLESGELSLEDALKGFEEGVALARMCGQLLSDAEQRVEILMKASSDGAQIETQPFQPPKT